jgi:uncharacterized membrane protein
MARTAYRRSGKLLPPRFMLFLLLMAAIALGLMALHGQPWANALVIGFDIAASAFTLSLLPLLRDRSAANMRRDAAGNDAGRGLVLLITSVTAAAIMAAIAAELPSAKQGDLLAITNLIGTLALSWAFTNLIFMLHYAHMHYVPADDGSGDHGGFDFPGTKSPDYWDFLYFAFTAGMSFAASDVNVTSKRVRRVVVAHCLLSFVFNIGVLAFSINVLAGAAG